MENEIWKDVPGYEGIYMVSDLGRVKSLERTKLGYKNSIIKINERIINGYTSNNRYTSITFHKNNKQKTFEVHKLVAMAFLNHIPDGTRKIVVDHINNIKTDNRVCNLQLITQRENSSKDKNKLKFSACKTRDGKFQSSIFVNGKTKYLGRFNNVEEAQEAYKKALSELNNKTK